MSPSRFTPTRRSAARLGRRLQGAFRLVRPFNVALFAVGVGVGGMLGAAGRGMPTAAALTAAAASAALVGAGGNALNDAFDVAIDRVNRPDRPIPAGVASVRTAWGVWSVTTAGGVALGAWVSPLHGLLAALAALALFAYNARLKRTMLAGNVVVAGVVALALAYGGAAVGGLRPALVGAVFAALTTFAREIVKDIEDAAGDAASGARTLAVAHGPAARRVAAGTLLVTVALTPFPFLLPYYGGLFLLGVTAADALLLRALWHLYAADGGGPARASGVLKGAMLAGLAALALAGAG